MGEMQYIRSKYYYSSWCRREEYGAMREEDTGVRHTTTRDWKKIGFTSRKLCLGHRYRPLLTIAFSDPNYSYIVTHDRVRTHDHAVGRSKDSVIRTRIDTKHKEFNVPAELYQTWPCEDNNCNGCNEHVDDLPQQCAFYSKTLSEAQAKKYLHQAVFGCNLRSTHSQTKSRTTHLNPCSDYIEHHSDFHLVLS